MNIIFHLKQNVQRSRAQLCYNAHCDAYYGAKKLQFLLKHKTLPGYAHKCMPGM